MLARQKYFRVPRHRRASSRGWWWPFAILFGCGLLTLAVRGAAGGFSAGVTNTGNSLQTGSLLTVATVGVTTECDLGTAPFNPIVGANTAGCTGNLATSGTLPGSGATSVSTTVSDKGSLPATASSVVTGACGPVALANSATSSDPMLVRGLTLTYAQPGPLAGGFGLGLSGTSGYAADVTAVPGPTTTSFTEAIWFKSTSSGSLIGFTNTPVSSGAGQWDKMLWIDNAGHVVFAVYPGTTVELTSAGTYLDGNWHFAVGVLNTVTGMSLSVDGGTPVTNTTKSAQSYTGYWHVGWDNENTGWTDPPTDPFFKGTLADAAVFPSALTAGQIATLYGAGTQSAWTTAVTSDAAGNSWYLGDAGTSAFTGTVPGVAPNACAFVNATLGATAGTATCAAPVSASACTAPTSAVTLASLANSTTSIAAFPTPVQTVTLGWSMARSTTITVGTYPDAVGLHLTFSATAVANASGFSASLTWPTENVIL